MDELSAWEHAERVAQAIRPNHRLAAYPTPSKGAFERECCPRRGRRVGFALTSILGGVLAPRSAGSRPELIAACLVDGPRARSARPYAMEELIESAGVIAAALQLAGWRAWVDLFVAAHQRHPDDRIEAVGLALDALRAYGPLVPSADMAKDPTRRGHVAATSVTTDLGVLVASSARFWPARGDPW